MDDYFDKDKFTGSAGGQGKTPPPPRPPQRPPQQNNAGWYSWPVIIILFSLGIWPVALVLLFLNIFGDSGRRKNPGGTRQSSAARQGESAVERAMRSAEARADRAVRGGTEGQRNQRGTAAADAKPHFYRRLCRCG